MSKVAVIAGYSPVGISHAVAARFAEEGFKVALLSRTQSKLDASAAEFAKRGVTAKGFAVDLSDSDSVKATIAKVSADLGPITVLLWNPYGVTKGLFDATQADLVSEFSLTTAGLVAAVQAAHTDLKAQAGSSAVLITGGGLSLELDAVVDIAVSWNLVTLPIAKAAQRKLGHILNRQLKKDDIYVTQLTVLPTVKGTAGAAMVKALAPDDEPTLTTEAVADKFWELYSMRDYDVWEDKIGAP